MSYNASDFNEVTANCIISLRGLSTNLIDTNRINDEDISILKGLLIQTKRDIIENELLEEVKLLIKKWKKPNNLQSLL